MGVKAPTYGDIVEVQNNRSSAAIDRGHSQDKKDQPDRTMQGVHLTLNVTLCALLETAPSWDIHRTTREGRFAQLLSKRVWRFQSLLFVESESIEGTPARTDFRL